jgi:peroxiredoxin
MKKLSAVALLLALSAAFAAQAARATRPATDAKPAVAIGAVVPDFKLPDADGNEHTLASLKGSKGTVIIFIATKCPVSNAYNERMAKLAAEYRARGVNVVGINSNSNEPAAEVKAHAADKGLAFTILKDDGSQIADRFNAQYTPESFLLDAAGKLVYRGRIDNSKNADGVTSNDLRDALDATLAGRAVANPEVKGFGCSIKRPS